MRNDGDTFIAHCLGFQTSMLTARCLDYQTITSPSCRRMVLPRTTNELIRVALTDIVENEPDHPEQMTRAQRVNWRSTRDMAVITNRLSEIVNRIKHGTK